MSEENEKKSEDSMGKDAAEACSNPDPSSFTER